FERLISNLKKHCPDHRPTWTCLGVAGLALPTMHIEIDVVAHVPDK
ncbi:hypothetical protein JCM10212_004298, partial [Sporobolomyces blumeae]